MFRDQKTRGDEDKKLSDLMGRYKAFFKIQANVLNSKVNIREILLIRIMILNSMPIDVDRLTLCNYWFVKVNMSIIAV